MSNELVKYDPELNTIPLRRFTPVEMNLFFSVVSRMRDKGDDTVRFTFDQLKELSAYKPTFLDKYSPDQFEILGITDRQNTSGIRTKKYTADDSKKYNDLNARGVVIKDGKYKAVYARILVRNKKVQE
ncbi:RepB family plasmid replication initiator protein (plasmid) [Lactiplantibacillus pentosus]